MRRNCRLIPCSSVGKLDCTNTMVRVLKLVSECKSGATRAVGNDQIVIAGTTAS